MLLQKLWRHIAQVGHVVFDNEYHHQYVVSGLGCCECYCVPPDVFCMVLTTIKASNLHVLSWL